MRTTISTHWKTLFFAASAACSMCPIASAVRLAIVCLLAMVLNPVVAWLERRRIPRIAAVLLVMLAFLALVGTIVLFAVPPLANQVQGLVHNAPQVWQGIRARLDSLAQTYPSVAEALPQTDEIALKIGDAAGTVGNFLLRSTIGLVGGVLSLALAVLLLVFVLVNPQPLVVGYLTGSLPRTSTSHSRASNAADDHVGSRRCHQRVHHWLFHWRGNVGHRRATRAHVRRIRVPR